MQSQPIPASTFAALVVVPGDRLHAQYWFRAGSGTALTDALEIQVGPRPRRPGACASVSKSRSGDDHPDPGGAAALRSRAAAQAARSANTLAAQVAATRCAAV